MSAERLCVLVSDSPTLCGVEAFARRLAATAGPAGRTVQLGEAPHLQPGEALVINLPIVAWKKRLAAPIAAAAAARAAGREVVLVLHEWADLDWKRRLSYAPLMPLATALVVSSPEVADQIAASPLGRLAPKRRAIAPIPPNLVRPATTRGSPHTARIAAERARGRLILGQFGSIYPKKQSTIVLDIAAALVARGEDPFVVFAGSFVKGLDRVEEEFRAHIAALSLTDRVLVTGYVADDAEVFGVLDAVDVFAYVFAEGLTARRGSVLAAAMTGRPVIVNAPVAVAAFDHHPTYRRLLDKGVLRLVPHAAGPDSLADAVLAARNAPRVADPLDEPAAWRDALAAVRTVLA